MGPQPFGCGRRSPSQNIRAAKRLQWGRNLSVAEGAPHGPPVPKSSPLQWGRNLSVAEGGHDPANGDWSGTASMGPQPFGCGRHSSTPAITESRWLQWGRNLSVAEGSGCIFGGKARGSLQWGRNLSVAEGRCWAWRSGRACGFNGAATFRLRKAPRCSSAGRRTRGFNGAATFRLRKAYDRADLAGVDMASMGPQPFGCGRSQVRRRADNGIMGFNGAATFRLRKGAASFGASPFCALQWGRNLSVAEGRATARESAGRIGFNGAATFRLRKGCGAQALRPVKMPLQWGRNLSVAEGGRPARPAPFFHCFNGAATFRLRKDGIGVYGQSECMLQWGRNLSVAEGRTLKAA